MLRFLSYSILTTQSKKAKMSFLRLPCWIWHNHLCCWGGFRTLTILFFESWSSCRPHIWTSGLGWFLWRKSGLSFQLSPCRDWQLWQILVNPWHNHVSGCRTAAVDRNLSASSLPLAISSWWVFQKVKNCKGKHVFCLSLFRGWREMFLCLSVLSTADGVMSLKQSWWVDYVHVERPPWPSLNSVTHYFWSTQGEWSFCPDGCFFHHGLFFVWTHSGFKISTLQCDYTGTEKMFR